VLLDVLRGDTDDFNVYGHRTSLLPVELPQWLPHDVVEEMVIRFQKILLGEIITMMRQQKPEAQGYDPYV
jgi:hypothetical protein